MRCIANVFTVILFIFQFGACAQPQTPSLDDELGQLLMVGFRGMEVDSLNHIYQDIKEHNIGGVILFDYDVPNRIADRNVQNPKQVRMLVQSLQELGTTPLFIAIDQEGGRVNRLKSRYGFPAIPSADYLGSLNNADSTRFYYGNQAQLLSGLGINVNFAPVVDINTNPENPVIGSIERSYSSDTTIVTEQAAIAVQAYTNKHVTPVLKHFPGHGSSTKDSHLGIVDVTQTWIPSELSPYRSLIQANDAPAVMTAHIFNKSIDQDWPATLSSKTINGVLRDDLGFKGVVFSDDMQMGAIRNEYGLETAIEQALNAGVDVLVFANNTIYDAEIADKAITIIKQLIAEKRVPEQTIRAALKRIATLKQTLQ